MNYTVIKRYDIANGKGIRTSIWFSGCNGFNGKHCKGCFNSEAWNFNNGKPFDDEAKQHVFELLSDDNCVGLSVLGGEPLQQGNELYLFLSEVKERFPNKNIWLWTGYYLSELNLEQQKIIDLCDYVVDGRYVEEENKKKNLFRGSSNQTIWEKDKDSGKFIESSLN